jgi:hypothetical protein
VAGVKAADGKSQDAWAPRVREWRQLVQRLIADFAAGQAAVDPKPGACDYCHVAGLCRVGDDSIGAVEEAAEDAPGADDE